MRWFEMYGVPINLSCALTALLAPLQTSFTHTVITYWLMKKYEICEWYRLSILFRRFGEPAVFTSRVRRSLFTAFMSQLRERRRRFRWCRRCRVTPMKPFSLRKFDHHFGTLSLTHPRGTVRRCCSKMHSRWLGSLALHRGHSRSMPCLQPPTRNVMRRTLNLITKAETATKATTRMTMTKRLTSDHRTLISSLRAMRAMMSRMKTAVKVADITGDTAQPTSRHWVMMWALIIVTVIATLM